MLIEKKKKIDNLKFWANKLTSNVNQDFLIKDILQINNFQAKN